MTALPPPPDLSLMNEEAAEKQDFKHNWLYSVLPIKADYDRLILSGYCRLCDQAFTKEIPVDANPNHLTVTKMGVPKWGCTDPTAINY